MSALAGAASLTIVLVAISLAAIALAMTGPAAAQQPPAVHPPVPRPAPQTAQAPAPLQSQAPVPGQAPNGNVPQSTTATYADWVVQCQTQAGPPPQKFCDMAQVTQLQGKNVPFSRVAVAHPQKDQPVRLVVQVPLNASFATPVHIQTADADPGITAPFARCLPAGCFADFDLKDDVLKKLRAAAGVGKLSFADAGGQNVSVPLSFNGFAQAYDALARE
jgi:invasion protein IalB